MDKTSVDLLARGMLAVRADLPRKRIMKSLLRSSRPMTQRLGNANTIASNSTCRRGAASLAVVGSELFAVLAVCFAFATSVVVNQDDNSSASAARLEKRAHPVREVAIAGASGSHVAIAWDDRCIVLDRETHLQRLAWLRTGDERLTSIAASPHDDLLLLASSNHGLELVSTADGRALWQLPAGDHAPTAVRFSHDGETIAAALNRGFVSIIDVQSGVEKTRFQVSTEDIHLIAFTADDRHVLAPTSNTGFGVWSIATGKAVRHVGIGRDSITALDASADGRYIAIGTALGKTLVWDLEYEREVSRHEGMRLPVLSIFFQPDCESVVMSHCNGSISVFPVDHPERMTLVGQHDDSVRSMACHDHLLLSGGFDGAVRAWNLQSGAEVDFPQL